MTLTIPKTCSMGSSQTGLVGTIGVTLLNPDGTTHTARATAGIYEISGGCYGKQIGFDDDWVGSIKWDTGGGSPVYATEEYIYYENNPKVDTILTDTDELQTNQGNWITATGFNTVVPDAAGVAPTAVEIRQEMDTNSTKMAPSQVMADYKATGFSTHTAANVWSVGTRALTDKAGFALSTAGIKAIWDQLTSALTTVGSIGKLLVDNINATISSRNSTTPPTVIAIRQEMDANSTRLDADVSSRAPANEYDTQMGYIPSNLGDVPIASELNSAHGAGSWATATGFNTVVPDTAGTAAGLHATTDGKVDAIQTDSTAIKAKTDTIEWDNITSLIDEIGGKWELINNQMIFYKSDNATEIMRFNLFDSGGNPAMIDVYKRERVP